MALDFNAVKVLLWAKNLGASFDRTLTLGRQGLSCSTDELKQGLRDFSFPATEEQIKQCFERPPMTAPYADEFLRLLGAKELVSVDCSDFEGATQLHDLNEPFPESDHATYSLVLDAGTLEHIFDYPAALRHCLELVEPGGHFLTLTPANNLIGHGFYQFSPELFFRVLSAENGFALRKIVLYDCLKTDATFFEVKDPANNSRSRTHLRSPQPLYLAVLGERIAVKPILGRPPQQSDYIQAWERARQKASANGAAIGRLGRLRMALYPYWPQWVRRWKMAFFYRRLYGPPTLSNRQHFRPLSRQEVCGERAAALPVQDSKEKVA